MKKAFILCVLLTLFFSFAFAEMAETGDYQYSIREDGTVEIVKFTGGTDKLTIPSTLDGHLVTSIGNEAFFSCVDLTSITIPYSVTCIGDYAFCACESLMNITIPNSVTSIGDYAFRACESLTSITIPDSVTTIGDGAFSICYSLSDITLSNNVTSIGAGAFSSCKIKSITIPKSVNTIGDHAFYCCSSLTSITIPDNVTTIGEEAFAYCCNLTSVKLPDSLSSIGYYAFHGCDNLNRIALPNSLTSIGEGAFSCCESLASITIPKSVTSIGKESFQWCSRLKNVTISNNLISIGDYAFADCGDDLTILCNSGSKAQEYAETNGMTFLLVNSPACAEEDWKWIPDDNGCAVIISYIGNETSVVVPAHLEGCPVKTLCGFTGGENITNLVLSDGIETIESQVSLRSLQALVLPGSVHTIGASAFSYCKSLTTVLFTDEGLRRIDNYAFRWCNLETIILPNTVESIGRYAFEYGYKGTDLILPDHLTDIGSGAFDSSHKLETISFGSELRSLDYGAFSGCNSLKELDLPEGLVSIGPACFSDCKALVSVHLPESLESLGGAAFSHCTSLRSVNLPRSLSFPEVNPFAGCVNLCEITMDDDHPTMSLLENALVSADGKRLISPLSTGTNSNQTSYLTPDGVTEIGTRAFDNMPYETIELKPEVEEIDDFAFSWPGSMKQLIAQGHLRRVGNSAFEGAAANMFFMDGIDLIETSAFYNSPPLGMFYCKGDIGLLQSNALRGTEWAGFLVEGCIHQVEPGALGAIHSLFFNVTGGILSGDVPCVIDMIGKTAKIREGTERLNSIVWSGIQGKPIESIELPSSLVEINKNPFSLFPSLKEIILPDNSPFCFRNGALIRKEDGLLVGTALGAVSNIYVVPDEVQIIGDGALDELEAAVLRGNVTNVLYNPINTQLLLDNNCPLIKIDHGIISSDSKRFIAFTSDKGPINYTINVPDGVETIGKNAFYSTEISSVRLPESLRKIEDNAFTYCYYLQSLLVPASVDSFHENSICGCYNLRYFEMPACVTELTQVGALDADSPNGLVVLHDGIQFVAENTDAFPQRDYFSFEYGGPLFAVDDGSFVHEYLISRGYYPQYYILLGESLKHIPTPEERILDCRHEWIYRLFEDGTAEVLGYCGPSESLMIPDELDGHPTTSFAIGYPYFHDDDRVKSLYLPNSIRKINYSCLNAFFKDGVEIRMEQDTFAYRWCQAAGIVN